MELTKDNALKAILAISVIGMLFSGYLSYLELFAGAASCGAGVPGTISQIFGIPVCVYGLFMYLVIGALAYLALRTRK